MKKTNTKETVQQGESAGRKFYEAQANARTPWDRLSEKAQILYERLARPKK